MSEGRRRSGRVVRPARALVVAVAGAAVGVLGHAVGGGDVGGVLALIAPALLLGVAAGLVVSRLTWTAPRVAAALLAQQALAHVLGWIASGPGEAHPRLSALAGDHHPMHEHAALTPRMIAAHVLAAAAFAAALVPADRALSVLAGWVRRVVVVLRPHVVRRPPVAPLPARSRIPVPQLVALCVMRGNAPPGALCSG
jgi:hypothetical protein